MRKLIMLMFCIAVFTIAAQSQNISLRDLKSSKDKLKEGADKHPIDLADQNWKTKAKINISDVEESDLSQIVVVNVKDGSIVPQPILSGGILSYSLETLIEAGATSYLIQISGADKATIDFGIKKSAAAPIPSTPTTPPAPTPTGNNSSEEFEPYIGALTSANLIGNNKFLKNLTPVVNLGSVVTIAGKTEPGYGSFQLDVNPYLGSEIDTKDSVSFIPAMMLYGRAGFVFNSYLNYHMKKATLSLMPIGFGVKFLPNLQDSSFTVVQHNIRAGLTFKYDKVFLLGVQVTQGWHNMTSNSKQNFKKIFSKEATDISYITAIGQFGLKGKEETVTNYVYFEWRSLLSKKSYPGFTNTSILTIGIRKTLELNSGRSSIASAADNGTPPSPKVTRRRVHTLF
ncbi:MAG: hypothetical protein NTW29_03040 [Bacteroidetes bacterium]|nr:hypothetical protein [Bacteroidota bacterium]